MSHTLAVDTHAHARALACALARILRRSITATIVVAAIAAPALLAQQGHIPHKADMMLHMDAHGYMVQATWDGHTLTADGTNKASRMALRGQQHSDGPLVLEAGDIATVEWKEASRFTNGALIVHATDGTAYQLHFRRKQAEDFAALYRAMAS